MRVICPHCQTIYQLDVVDSDALLVCHRCGAEFGLSQTEDAVSADMDKRTPDMFVSEPTDGGVVEQDGAQKKVEIDQPVGHPIVRQDETQTPAGSTEDRLTRERGAGGDADAAGTGVDIPEPGTMPTDEMTETEGPVPGHQATRANNVITDHPADDEDTDRLLPDDTEIDAPPPPTAPPPRRKARIMPWLFAVLIVIAGSGFWLNHDAWLDDPWLRSVLLNAGFDIQVRDKDWYIAPESVEATWLERGSADNTVLVVTGEVHNRLQSDLQPPSIHFVLYARDNPDERILERDLSITRPPLMQAIRQAPYSPPPRDITPVPALGKRGFVLVLEDMPQNSGNFTLSPTIR